ncbi:MAG: hypothetical protein AAF900_00480 [Bacteroidota bacterium]
MTNIQIPNYEYILSFTKSADHVYYCLLHKKKLLEEGDVPCSVLAFNGLFNKLKAWKVDFAKLVCCVERKSMRIFPLVFVAQYDFMLQVLTLPPQKANKISTQKQKAHAIALYSYQQQYFHFRHHLSKKSQDKARLYWQAKQSREEIEELYGRFDQKLIKIAQLLKEAREDAANYNFYIVEDIF